MSKRVKLDKISSYSIDFRNQVKGYSLNALSVDIPFFLREEAAEIPEVVGGVSTFEYITEQIYPTTARFTCSVSGFGVLLFEFYDNNGYGFKYQGDAPNTGQLFFDGKRVIFTDTSGNNYPYIIIGRSPVLKKRNLLTITTNYAISDFTLIHDIGFLV